MLRLVTIAAVVGLVSCTGGQNTSAVRDDASVPEAPAVESEIAAVGPGIDYVGDGSEVSAAADQLGSAEEDDEATFSGGTLQDEAVAIHNRVRGNVTVSPRLPDVTWSASLATYAKAWANFLATQHGCDLDHRVTLGQATRAVGENLSLRGPSPTTEQLMKGWIDEKQYFVRGLSSWCRGGECRHYTQMVWRDSTKIGCGTAVCPGTTTKILVCNYEPQGNFRGQQPY